MAHLPLTDADGERFDRDGYLVVDGLADALTLAALNARLDALMDGSVQYGERLLMQLDPSASTCGGGGGAAATAAAAASAAAAAATETAAYGDAAVAGQSVGFKGPSAAYRKIGEAQAGLEVDPLFLAWMRQPALRAVCAHVYGNHAGIGVYRAMVMCKPAGAHGGGTTLPWHQDGGDWWALDRDPLIFVWLALSPATRANGAVQVVRGSHRRGLLSRRGHTLDGAALAAVVDGAAPGDIVDVELQPGQAFLCHNWLVHRSGVNTTEEARRGFSVNFIDARTRVLSPKPPLAGPLGEPGAAFPLIWPSPFDGAQEQVAQ
jgi:ectoine hydroxylase-related dioxygenase (phytanoyl-CoA dioxygenase family)